MVDAYWRQNARGELIYDRKARVLGGRLPEDDLPTAGQVSRACVEALRRYGGPGSVVYAPSALGGHVDHLLVRMWAEELSRRSGAPCANVVLWRDSPYWWRTRARSDRLRPQGLTIERRRPEPRQLAKKLRCIGLYHSQALFIRRWREAYFEEELYRLVK